MTKYKIKDLRKFKKNDRGGLTCPTGDYTAIKHFDKNTSFGERCSFGEQCSLERSHKFEDMSEVTERVIKIDRIGSRKGATYFFKTHANIFVRCGCFFGDIKCFKEKVEETHKNNPQYLNEYLGAIAYIKSIMEVKNDTTECEQIEC